MTLLQRKYKKYINKAFRNDKKIRLYLLNLHWIKIKKQKERRRRRTLIKLYRLERLRHFNMLRSA